ncbi:MAG: DNA primase, partial [Muribaculaceae bacterium]|nr:DNA primase [Muribaculaceae bacterium]
MIDRATVQRIKDTANILEVVSDYVHLSRRGANYMGLCPFHNERTPSFSVNVRKNFCWCFSCRKGGSPVNFIMEKEGLSYHDALLQLAKKYGIKVEERELTDEERAAQTERESLMVAMEWAADKMAQDLRDTEEGRDIGLTYFYERGITDEAIKAFKLGYAPDKHDYLSRLMLSHGFELDVLRKIGITGKTENGRIYDRYHGRVIFPITNSAGHVVALGGRDLKGGMAKYINSNDSVLYSKKNELYGISQARSEMKNKDRCYLVEGYFDVISMWQSGIKNVVASSGTALTDNQIHLIHRFTENITLIYDGDSAGIHAAIRGIDMLLQHKMKVKVLLLPDNHDPDSFARQNTSEQFTAYIREHETDVIRFKMEVMLKDTENDIQARTQAIN